MAVLRSLHWLPIEDRISFKVLIITFKAIHGAAPEYLSNLISVWKVCRYSLWLNAGILVELLSARLKETLGDIHQMLLDFGISGLWILETGHLVLKIYVKDVFISLGF